MANIDLQGVYANIMINDLDNLGIAQSTESPITYVGDMERLTGIAVAAVAGTISIRHGLDATGVWQYTDTIAVVAGVYNIDVRRRLQYAQAYYLNGAVAQAAGSSEFTVLRRT